MNRAKPYSVEKNKLPWWTWVAPLIILHIGSEISALLKYVPGGTFFYLPTCLGIVLINWWGPKRILPAMYINAILSAHLWDVGPWYLWPIFSLPGVIFIALSWYLFSKVNDGKYWLPDTYSLTSFLIFGITIPLLVEILLLEGSYFIFGLRTSEVFLFTFIRSSLGEFISTFGLTIPLLYYFTPFAQKKGIILEKARKAPEVKLLARRPRIEIITLYILIFILSISIPFNKFWFIYGVFSLFMAIRYGFSLSILTNTYIFILTYIIPLISNKIIDTHFLVEDHVINIYLGTSLLYVFSAITGRVISDVTNVEKRVVDQLYQLEMTNKELEVTNKELDRFAYSVSHDLSAPLKSILGVVNISRITTSVEDHQLYFTKIEASVKKLDTFIHEILDYTRNRRQDLVIEPINLKTLCEDIVENLQLIDGDRKVRSDMNGLCEQNFHTDKTRLKVILNNIITNAFKYQKFSPEHNPFIKIYSTPKKGGLLLHIEDNGEGMLADVQEKIFTMFYRGNQRSKGSGLGLYIAKEAAEKINSYISVSSSFGNGTIFTIELEDLKANA